jgi:hypothetical protein
MNEQARAIILEEILKLRRAMPEKAGQAFVNNILALDRKRLTIFAVIILILWLYERRTNPKAPALDDKENGWVTINGTPVKIKDGELQGKTGEKIQAGKEQPRQDITKLLGPEYTGVKGQAAIDKLLAEKQGHVKGAFYREDIGHIDLLWGNDRLGLQHIIRERETKDSINAREFLADIAGVIETGYFYGKNKYGDFLFRLDKKVAVVALTFKNNKLVFLLTAFKTHSKPKNH